jgi:threonine/homoserine/homoserine lactone efflux protein
VAEFDDRFIGSATLGFLFWVAALAAVFRAVRRSYLKRLQITAPIIDEIVRATLAAYFLASCLKLSSE